MDEDVMLPPAPVRPAWSRAVSVGLVALGGGFWLAGLAPLVFAVPRFTDIFMEFEIEGGLPWLTQVCIESSRALMNACCGFGVVWVAVVGGLAALAGVSSSRRALPLAGVFAALSLLGMLVLLALVFAAMFLPLTRLVTEVGARQ
jgi:hypothetical protein